MALQSLDTMKVLVQINYNPIPFPSQEAELAAGRLTDNQRAHVQNLLSRIVQEKANIPVDTANLADYTYKMEYLRGQINILTYLLELSDATSQSQG